MGQPRRLDDTPPGRQGIQVGIDGSLIGDGGKLYVRDDLNLSEPMDWLPKLAPVALRLGGRRVVTIDHSLDGNSYMIITDEYQPLVWVDDPDDPVDATPFAVTRLDEEVDG